MACVNRLLQILFFQKYRFAELLSSSPSQCGLQKLLCYRRQSFQIFANMRGKKIESFKLAPDFVTIHPWTNSKWVSGQSERALYFCSVIYIDDVCWLKCSCLGQRDVYPYVYVCPDVYGCVWITTYIILPTSAVSLSAVSFELSE